jgi:hypothetical protein
MLVGINQWLLNETGGSQPQLSQPVLHMLASGMLPSQAHASRWSSVCGAAIPAATQTGQILPQEALPAYLPCALLYAKMPMVWPPP